MQIRNIIRLTVIASVLALVLSTAAYAKDSFVAQVKFQSPEGVANEYQHLVVLRDTKNLSKDNIKSRLWKDTAPDAIAKISDNVPEYVGTYAPDGDPYMSCLSFSRNGQAFFINVVIKNGTNGSGLKHMDELLQVDGVLSYRVLQ